MQKQNCIQVLYRICGAFGASLLILFSAHYSKRPDMCFIRVFFLAVLAVFMLACQELDTSHKASAKET
jgi:hypothetical protein